MAELAEYVDLIKSQNSRIVRVELDVALPEPYVINGFNQN
jgi:hypothetical protein